MNSEFNTAVIKATEDTFQRLFKLPVTYSKPVQINKSENHKDINVLINFMGEPSGALLMKFDDDLAGHLCSQMLGKCQGISGQDIKDSAGEILNIIIGRAKSFYPGGNSFSLSIPTIITGKDFESRSTADKISGSISRIDFGFKKMPFMIEIYISA